MNTPKRLFDRMEAQLEYNLPQLLGWKEGGEWKALSTREVQDRVFRLTNALLTAGIESIGEPVEASVKIGIISSNRPEWIITDLAVQLTGAILVPLYPNTSSQDIAHILNEAAVEWVFAGTKEDHDRIDAVRHSVPSLAKLVTFDQVEGAVYWQDLLQPISSEQRESIQQTAAEITEEDITTLIYTSGTTGRPKGVMLSHKNIMSNVMAAYDVLKVIPLQERKALSFLPLNHIFEKMVTYVFLYYGFSIYYAQSIDTIGEDLKEVKPHLFTAVPRLLEKVYARIMLQGEKLTGLKRSLFFWSVALGKRYDTKSSRNAWYRLQLGLARRLVFSKWQQALGGNVKAIVVGGAACQEELARIFTAAGIVIMEGYGLTETSPVIAVNSYDPANRRFGTVGVLLPGVQVRIMEDGEIICAGPNIMKGYYLNKAATDEVIKDGWFYTGDIGVWVDQRFLKITDRKKELFKTSGGKYVAPLPLENKLKLSPLVEHVLVVGQGQRFAGALIVPSFVNLRHWCQQRGIACTTNREIICHPEVVALYQGIVEASNSTFNKVEQIKQFALLAEDWSVDSGELTPKGSLRRKVIAEKYKSEIDKLYQVELKV